MKDNRIKEIYDYYEAYAYDYEEEENFYQWIINFIKDLIQRCPHF